MPGMPNTPRTWKRNLIILWGLFSIPFLVLTILFILLGKGKLGYVPTFEDLENPKNNLASEIWSADSVLLSKYYLQNRTYVDFIDLSPNIVNALLATGTGSIENTADTINEIIESVETIARARRTRKENSNGVDEEPVPPIEQEEPQTTQDNIQ